MIQRFKQSGCCFMSLGIASCVPGKAVKAEEIQRKITGAEESVASSSDGSDSEAGSGGGGRAATNRDSNLTKVASGGVIDAEKRKNMVPETYAFINATSCRRKALIEPFAGTDNLPENCSSCDLCLVMNGDQDDVEIRLGKPDVPKVTKTPVRRVAKPVRPALLKLLDNERLFMHYLYELYIMFVPSMIITDQGITNVLKNWGRVDTLEDFNSYLGWEASWSNRHGAALYAKAVETATAISASCKVEKAAKSAATKKGNQDALHRPLAERSSNIPARIKPTKQPAKPKSWTIVTPQSFQGLGSTSSRSACT